MTYGDYQKYLADGGWQAVSMHEERLEVVSQQLGAHAGLISRLQERVEGLEEGRRFAQGVIAWVIAAVVCAVFILIMTGVP